MMKTSTIFKGVKLPSYGIEKLKPFSNALASSFILMNTYIYFFLLNGLLTKYMHYITIHTVLIVSFY